VLSRWLARLATSFAIVAVVLAWEGYRAWEAGAAIWRPMVDLFAAAAGVAMAFVGTRERHRAARAAVVHEPRHEVGR
jgi:hypothetical protein